MAPPQNDEEARGAVADATASVVDSHLLTLVIAAAADRDKPLLRTLLIDLHPADIADVLRHIHEHAREQIIKLIGPDLPPEMWLELDDDLREDVLKLLPSELVGKALGKMDTDDAAIVADSLEGDKLAAALAVAPEDVRTAVESSLSSDEESAGRLMQREFVAAPEHWNVGQTIDHLRGVGEDDLPDLFFEIYVVDPYFRPIGAVPVSKLLRATRETPIQTVMRPPQTLIRPEMDQEEVAFAFQRYNLASAPVVDDAGRLTGMVTIDDVVHVIQEENSEDLLALSGVSESSQTDTVIETVRTRVPWLVVNLFTAVCASSVIAFFQGSIEKAAALAILMPIVASLGGNAGTQALAVSVRALASRDLTTMNAARFVAREVMTGSLNGLVIAAVLAIVAAGWFHQPKLSLAIGLAVVVNLTVAGLVGSLVPLGLKRFGADPAVSSSVFVTWATDTVGFLAFLGIATIILFS